MVVLMKIMIIITINCFQINNLKMLYFDRTDVSAGIDLDKTCVSKEFIISHYCYFYW